MICKVLKGLLNIQKQIYFFDSWIYFDFYYFKVIKNKSEFFFSFILSEIVRFIELRCSFI